jgi:kinesin family protein 1
LNFLEEKSIGWSKRFVVSDIFLLFVKPRFWNYFNRFKLKKAIRRPYVFIYMNEKDPVEMSVFNLSTAQIVYNTEQIEMLKVRDFLMLK